MDPVLNPYAAGAGTKPPELAGRDQLIRKADIALGRIVDGRFAKSPVLTGLRGVGKTVLLNHFRAMALQKGLTDVRIEATEGQSLSAMLAEPLHSALLKLDRVRAAGAALKSAVDALKTLIGSVNIPYQDADLSLGLPQNQAGALSRNLASVFQEIGKVASERNTAVILFVDELHVVDQNSLVALIQALHLVSQDGLPVMMMAAGLPSISAQMGQAKTYAERLFEFPRIEHLPPSEARRAIVAPAERQQVGFTDEAIDLIFEQTKGYPYFLQEWASCSWDVAKATPITKDDVELAKVDAINNLDVSFFRTRIEQLSPAQKRYMRAMAELGEGPQRTGDIAKVLGRSSSGVASIRDHLMAKGVLYSPGHGLTEFTVPMFDDFLRRTIAWPVEDFEQRLT
jgi:hypothetical protein